MNRYAGLQRRAAEGRPIRVGLIGGGVFGAMYAAQARRTPGVHLAAVADLDPARAAGRLKDAGWEDERLAAPDLAAALAHGSTLVTDDARALLDGDGLEVIVEATGSPVAGIRHARAAIDGGRHVVMVNVEADVLAGPGLAAHAAAAGVVYSLAYGDQPALICELVDWARTAGFEVVAAGKGTKYLPGYHAITPDDVWEHFGLSEAAVRAGGLNAQMFASFVDGTKSAIEMAAVANATGLSVPAGGLRFPPAGADQLAQVLRDRDGAVEVVASNERDGGPLERDLRQGVFVVFRAADDFVAARLADYAVVTDDSGCYAALYRPYHLIGLELGISVASVALDGEPTGAPIERRGQVVAVAKRDLAVGDELDGEGGYTAWGRLEPVGAGGPSGPADRSGPTHRSGPADPAAAAGPPGSLGPGLPIGLARGARLTAPVKAGDVVALDDVELPDGGAALDLVRSDLRP